MKYKLIISMLVSLNLILLYWGNCRYDRKLIDENYISKNELEKFYYNKLDYSNVIDKNKYDGKTFLLYGLATRDLEKIQFEYKDYDILIKAVADCSVSKVNMDKWNVHNEIVIKNILDKLGNPNDEKIIKLSHFRL